MKEQDRYGTEQLVQGKKEALTERVEEIKKGREEEPENEHSKIHKLLLENYKQALGPHTQEEDGRVGIFNELLKEYTLVIIKECMQVFADVQVREVELMIKGRQEE